MNAPRILLQAWRMVSPKASFSRLSQQSCIFLYAGDVPSDSKYSRFTGLSLSQSNSRHVRHDIIEPLPLSDNSVDIYQSEDVFEHVSPCILPTVINEIYRVLKPGGLFRLSLPDYRCNVLSERSLKDDQGVILFDPGGGGNYINGNVVDGGHVWFPIYETVRDMLFSTLFTDISFYHFYDEGGTGVTHTIDYSLGYVMRTPDHDERVQHPYRPMSIVVDCRK
jgi:SAM-dependent methyltransferase